MKRDSSLVVFLIVVVLLIPPWRAGAAEAPTEIGSFALYDQENVLVIKSIDTQRFVSMYALRGERMSVEWEYGLSFHAESIIPLIGIHRIAVYGEDGLAVLSEAGQVLETAVFEHPISWCVRSISPGEQAAVLSDFSRFMIITKQGVIMQRIPKQEYTTDMPPQAEQLKHILIDDHAVIYSGNKEGHYWRYGMDTGWMKSDIDGVLAYVDAQGIWSLSGNTVKRNGETILKLPKPKHKYFVGSVNLGGFVVCDMPSWSDNDASYSSLLFSVADNQITRWKNETVDNFVGVSPNMHFGLAVEEETLVAWSKDEKIKKYPRPQGMDQSCASYCVRNDGSVLMRAFDEATGGIGQFGLFDLATGEYKPITMVG